METDIKDYDLQAEELIEKHGVNDHFHEEHQGDKYQSGFFSKYVFSLDHKMIAKQFLLTGIFWAIIGAGMSVIFRLQLGYPDADLHWLKPLLGKWINLDSAGVGSLSPDFYLALVTMHGTILIFFVLTAGLSGTFANLLLPLQLGARDMASPIMNMMSSWFFMLASVVMFFSLFLSTGPFSGGWVAYPPLSVLPQASTGSGAGMTLWLAALILFVISNVLGGVNYITTILNMRTKGMTMWRMPLTVWSILVTAIVGLLAFPVLFAGFLLLIFDRSLGTSFYLSEIFIGGQALDHVGGSPILYQHLFWFLGHPEVYIVILPAMGIVSEVLAINARKPIFGYRAMVYSLLTIGFLSFLVWAHHMFMSGINPFLASIFSAFSMIIAVPSSVKVFNWLSTIFRGNIRFNSASLFAIGFVSMFISGGLTGLFMGNAVLDIQIHDTYFIVAHFHLVMGVAAIFGMLAGVYHWYPKFYARHMNETLGQIHFWGTIIAAYMVFWPMHYLGMFGVPRRYYSFDAFDSFKDFTGINKFITIGAIIGFLVQFLFIVNFFYSIWRGRKMTSKNPYKATTLEWTTPIHTPHGNWPGNVPVVERWAYDYSKNGEDYVPQVLPLREGEEAH